MHICMYMHIVYMLVRSQRAQIFIEEQIDRCSYMQTSIDQNSYMQHIVHVFRI